MIGWNDLQTRIPTSVPLWGMALAAGSYTENVHFAFINGAQNKADWFDKDGRVSCGTST
ncbi:hypothetical protein [Kribbella catacumbae]|uniref:hypothetical protein n=1 Tax=Kribbella catacumbae TaxID=460086 RepID=UPI000372567E